MPTSCTKSAPVILSALSKVFPLPGISLGRKRKVNQSGSASSSSLIGSSSTESLAKKKKSRRGDTDLRWLTPSARASFEKCRFSVNFSVAMIFVRSIVVGIWNWKRLLAFLQFWRPS